MDDRPLLAHRRWETEGSTRTPLEFLWPTHFHRTEHCATSGCFALDSLDLGGSRKTLAKVFPNSYFFTQFRERVARFIYLFKTCFGKKNASKVKRVPSMFARWVTQETRKLLSPSTLSGTKTIEAQATCGTSMLMLQFPFWQNSESQKGTWQPKYHLTLPTGALCKGTHIVLVMCSWYRH